MDCSTPGFPVHYQLPELSLTNVQLVGDVIQSSYPLSSPSPPAFNSFPGSRCFPMSQFFVSGGQNIGVSASASVLPMNIQDWFPLGLADLFPLQSALVLGHVGFSSHSIQLSSCGTLALLPMACGIFPDQGLNMCPLHWQVDFLPLYHRGSLRWTEIPQKSEDSAWPWESLKGKQEATLANYWDKGLNSQSSPSVCRLVDF